MNRTVLLLTWPGAGNQPPAIALVQALRQAGHQVTIAGDAAQGAIFRSRDFPFEPLPAHAASGGPPLREHVRRSWANARHPAALAALLASLRPDALVIDCLMFAALAAAESAGLPAVVFLHSAPGALVPADGSLERAILPALNDLRHGLGLPGLVALRDAWRPFVRLCASLPDLDPAPGDAAGIFVGPLFDADLGSWQPPWPSHDRRPLVLASFSTGAAWDQASRIARTAHALGGGRYRVLFTTAGTSHCDDMVFTSWAPHRRVLAGAAATVCHAGHGTIMASLAAGVPMVCLPNPGADQQALAERVQALGAGLALDGEHASPDAIREAVRRVGTEAPFAAAAAALATKIRHAPGPAAAVALLERICASRPA